MENFKNNCWSRFCQKLKQQLQFCFQLLKTICFPFKTIHYFEQYIKLVKSLQQPKNQKSRRKLYVIILFFILISFSFPFLYTRKKYSTVEHLLAVNMYYLLMGHHQFNVMVCPIYHLICFNTTTLLFPSKECTRLMDLLQKILILPVNNASKKINKNFSNYRSARKHVKKWFLFVLNSFHSFTLFSG